MTKTINLRDLPEELVWRAKACAAIHGLTLKGFVVQAIEKAVERDVPARSLLSALARAAKRRKSKR